MLAIWEPFGGFEWNKHGQPQMNSLLRDLIEADSTKRGNLYLLPIGRKPLIYNDRSDEQQQIEHILKFHKRKDCDYSFPYSLYKRKLAQKQKLRKKRWIKRKEKQNEYISKTNAMINELDKNNKEDKLQQPQTQQMNQSESSKREKRLYEKEKLNKERRKKEDSQEYKLQIRELNDLKLAVEWLKNSISLFKKMEIKLHRMDVDGHICAHLHLSFVYLKLKAWNFAFRHAENTINLTKKHKQNDANAQQSLPSSEWTYLAHLYAAEALIHLNKFNQAIQHLNPANFPHLNGVYTAEKLSNQSPKSCKSEREIDGKGEIDERKRKNASNSAPNCGGNEVEQKMNVKARNKETFSNIKHKEQYRQRVEEKERERESNNYLAILVNLATAYICKDALDKAHKYIHKALTLNDEYYPALRMLIYLQMRMGNNSEAIKILKYRRPIPVKQFMQQTDSSSVSNESKS